MIKSTDILRQHCVEETERCPTRLNRKTQGQFSQLPTAILFTAYNSVLFCSSFHQKHSRRTARSNSSAFQHLSKTSLYIKPGDIHSKLVLGRGRSRLDSVVANLTQCHTSSEYCTIILKCIRQHVSLKLSP